jgi:hypothetical protein
MTRKLEIDPRELERLYRDEMLSTVEIASIFNTNPTTINRHLRRAGVPLLSKTERTASAYPRKLSSNQEQILLGSLMGDGHLSVGSSNLTARFSEGHARKQEGYVRWKAEVLAPFSHEVQPRQKCDRGRVFYSFSFDTAMLPVFRPYYDAWYATGERVFPVNLPELITPLVFAVWYQDDGSISDKGRNVSITVGIGELSIERACTAVKKLGLEAFVSRTRGDTTVGLRFPGQHERVRELLEPYMHPSMLYKLPSKEPFGRKGFTPERLRFMRDSGLTEEQLVAESGLSLARVRLKLKRSEQNVRGKGKKRGPKFSTLLPKAEEWSLWDSNRQDRLVEEIDTYFGGGLAPAIRHHLEHELPITARRLVGFDHGQE